MVTWNDVKDAITYVPRAIATDSKRLYGGSKEVWNDGAAADPDGSRRDVIKGTGFFLAAGATPGKDIVEDTAKASPVGVQNPFTYEGGGNSDSSDPTPEQTRENGTPVNDENIEGDNEGNDTDLDYSREMCGIHAELEEDVQRDIEGYLRTLTEVDDASIEELEVKDDLLYSPSDRFAPVEITGSQGGQDQFGATEEYAHMLDEAYINDEEDFYDGLNSILEGQCN